MAEKKPSAGCAFGNSTRMYRRKGADDPMSRLPREPGRLLDRDDANFDSFQYFPHSSDKCSETTDAFFRDYADFLTIDADADTIPIPKASSECETCPEKKGCPEFPYHSSKKHFRGKLKESRLPLPPSSSWSARKGRAITLKDVRMNGYRVELELNRFRYTDESGKEGQISLAPVQFLSFGVTTRLAIAVADLYQNYAAKLIMQGFGLSRSMLYRILESWHSLNYSGLNPDHIYWAATGTLGDAVVKFVVDATEMTLCGIRYLKKSGTKYWYPPGSTDFAVFGMMPDIEPFEAKSFSYNDVHTLLDEIFQLSWRTSPPKVDFAKVAELHETFTEELTELRFLCSEITDLLKSSMPNDPAIVFLCERINQQLRLLALLANSQDQSGSRMLPVLGNAAARFLKQWWRIATDPADYKQGDPSRFSGANRQKLALLLEFLQTLKQASQGNRNLRGMCHRLTLFNEPASAKVIDFGQTGQPRIVSAYSLLKPEDFYQPHIQISPPPISCLIHLVKHGLLDTEAPVIDLPCVKHRLTSNGQDSCKIPVCPVLDSENFNE